MSNPKTFHRYAEQWMRLFEQFVEQPNEVWVVMCDNEKQAKTLRLEFYKARESFLENAQDLVENPLEYGQVLNGREVRVKGKMVLFENKDAGWIAKLLDMALMRRGAPPAAPPSEPPADKPTSGMSIGGSGDDA